MLGPEAPLIAIGSGLGVLAVHLLKRDAPEMACVVIGAAGSFAAISTLLGSPLVGAFLLMEAAGLGGAMMGVVLIPGLLAAGVGTLIFVGLEQLDGLRHALAGDPRTSRRSRTPTVAEFLWAIGIGLAAAVLGTAIKRLALHAAADRRAPDAAADAGVGLRDRWPGGAVRRVHRSRRRPRCCSPARTRCRG